MIENYIIHILILMCIYIIFAIVTNITLGNLGLLSMGNVAFFGIGAYTSAILSMKEIPFIFAIIIAMMFGGLFAIVMSFLMRKLKDDYYAIGTLAFMFVTYSIFLNWSSVTRGALGISGIPKPNFFGFIINTLPEYLTLCIIITIITILLFKRILNSNYSLVLSSIRDNETASKILGYDTFKVKMIIMFLVGAFSALSGALLAHYITFIDPSSFYMSEVIFILTIVIIGGLGSLKGSIFGTILLILIPEILRFVGLPSSMIGPVRQILYSLILILIIWYSPKGLFGEVDL